MVRGVWGYTLEHAKLNLELAEREAAGKRTGKNCPHCGSSDRGLRFIMGDEESGPYRCAHSWHGGTNG